MSDQIKMMSVEAALRNMFNNKHFSICTMDTIIKMLNLHPDPDVYNILHTLHCVDYAQMHPSLLNALPELISKVLDSPSFSASRINLVTAGQSIMLVKH